MSGSVEVWASGGNLAPSYRGCSGVCGPLLIDSNLTSVPRPKMMLWPENRLEVQCATSILIGRAPSGWCIRQRPEPGMVELNIGTGAFSGRDLPCPHLYHFSGSLPWILPGSCHINYIDGRFGLSDFNLHGNAELYFVMLDVGHRLVQFISRFIGVKCTQRHRKSWTHWTLWTLWTQQPWKISPTNVVEPSPLLYTCTAVRAYSGTYNQIKTSRYGFGVDTALTVPLSRPPR